MKKPSLFTLVMLAVLALGSGVTIAQFIQPGGLNPGGLNPVPPSLEPEPSYNYSTVLAPGQSYLIHASEDVVIELFVDIPISVNENFIYENPRNPGKFIIPNLAPFRAQGPVMISRSAESNTIAKTFVRWRYVDSMFTRYSRPPQRNDVAD